MPAHLPTSTSRGGSCSTTSGRRSASRRKANLLRTVIDSVYVQKGHSQKGDPIEARTLIRWAGEDRFERPKRGTTDYRSKPVSWPPDAALPLVNIPEWAIRMGHPALPPELVEDIRAEAHRQDAPWYLPSE